MAGIVFKTAKFAIVDEKAFINEIYRPNGLQIDPTLFDINGPFMMDSQFEAQQQPNRRIRKRKRPVNEALQEVWSWIEELLPEIQQAGTSNGLFGGSGQKNNNKQARAAGKAILEGCKHGEIVSNDLKNGGGFWFNVTDDFLTIQADDKDWIIPPRASFHRGDVSFLENLTDSFDLIVADPPWLNKSAKRTAGYELSDDVFHDLNLECLDGKKGLICVWITNQPRIVEEVKATLETWGMELVATWYWLKVTKEGEPVCDCQSGHKVPFEKVLIGCARESVEHWKTRLPDKFLFVSVPMSVHSRKPPMQLLLSVFGHAPSRPLELFARNLWPDTTSVGYEPLLLQSASVFQPIKPG